MIHRGGKGCLEYLIPDTDAETPCPETPRSPPYIHLKIHDFEILEPKIQIFCAKK